MDPARPPLTVVSLTTLLAVPWLGTSLSGQDRGAEAFQVGIGLLQRGMHEEAAAQFERFLKAAPKHALAAEAWYRLGVCRIETKELDAAAQAMESALQNREGFKLRAEARYRLGHLRKEQNQHEPAHTQFAAILQEEPRDHYLVAAAAFADGEALRELGQKDAALAAFTQASTADQDPNGQFAAPALYATGYLHWQAGNSSEACAAFRTAADRFGKHELAAECRAMQGEVSLRAGSIDEARTAFAAARELGGEFVDDALFGLARCAVAAKDDTKALDLLRTLQHEHGKSSLLPRSWIESARILQRQKKHEAAAAELVEPLRGELPPELRATALELRGMALLDGKKAEEALAPLAEALKWFDSKQDAAGQARLHFTLGECHSELQQWEPAVREYSAATGGPDKALAGDAFYACAVAFHRMGRFADALTQAQQVAKIDSNHRLVAPAQFAAAENMFALKSYVDARKQYDEVLQGKQASQELKRKAAFKLAWCHFLGKDPAQAASAFAALVEPPAGSKEIDSIAEESLSMVALAQLEAGQADAALAAADRYRARFQKGVHLARTERVASRVLQQKGDLRAAAERAANAAASSGKDAGLDLVSQAELLYAAKDYVGARKIYDSLLDRSDAVGARALEGSAWCAFELGEDAPVLALIDRALGHAQVGDRGVGLRELQTAVHHKHERWQEAAAAAKAGVELAKDGPRAGELTYMHGVALARGGQDEPARKLLESIDATTVAKFDRVQYELGWACKRMGDAQAAVRAFQVVAETSKDPELVGEARLHMGEQFLDDKQIEPGRAMLTHVTGRYRGRALYRIAGTWLEAADHGQAATAFGQAIEAGVGDLKGEAQFLCGDCWMQAKQEAKAVEPLRALVEQSPDHARAQLARVALARAELTLDRAAPAIQVLAEFVRRDDGKERVLTARAHLALGIAQQRQKQLEPAEASFAKVTELSDGELAAEAQYRLGVSRRERGQADSAIDAFLKLSILYSHPDWVPQGLFAAANCYEERNQKEKASKLYQELLERFPKAQAAAEAKSRLAQIRGE